MSDKRDSHLSKHEYNKRYYQANKPYPIRLGDLKEKLQQEAFEKDRSIHEVLKKIVKDHYDNRDRTIKEILEPLSKLK